MIRRGSLVAATAGLLAALFAPGVAVSQEEGTATDDPVTSEVAPVEESDDPAVTTESEGTGGEESTEASTEESTGESSTVTVEPASSTEQRSTATQSSVASVSTRAGTATLKAKKRKRSRKARNCSTATRALAQGRAPEEPGCFRLERGDFPGPLVLPDGTRLHFTEPSEGTAHFTVSGGPTGTFTGRIIAKGGPEGQTVCTFSNVTSGSCSTPGNHGVSHVDACPGQFVPPTPTVTGAPAPGAVKKGQVKAEAQKKKGDREAAAGFAAARAVVAAQRGEQLPFTGLPVLWLLLLGSGLVGSGAALRLRSRD